MNNPTESDANLFPRGLYGTARNTKKFWQDVVRKGWEHEDWHEVLDSLEMVPLSSLPGWILIHDNGGKSSAKASHWRMFWIEAFNPFSDLLCDRKEAFDPSGDRSKDREPKSLEKHCSLVTAGMKRLWFTVGMLWPGNQMSHYCYEPRGVEQLHLPMLRWYIYWLPVLIVLQEKYAIGVSDVLPCYNQPSELRYAFLHGIQSTAGCVGRPLSDGLMRRIEDTGGDVGQVLMEEGLIEPRGSGFQLRE